MKVNFEYGKGTIAAELPDNSDVFIPGQTVPDPPHIPEDKIKEETLKSIRNPIGMPTLPELVENAEPAPEDCKVVIVFPDRVKGGEQPTAHRQVAIPLILNELFNSGVSKKNVLLLCSNGLHRKNTMAEIKGVLGEELFNEYYYTHQILNHDSEDYDHLVDLGITKRGDPVLCNSYVNKADIVVMIGHTLGNPYGGYSGGYKHCATGITHWRSIATHHVPEVMHRNDFTPVNGNSLMRHKFNEIGMHLESHSKCGKFFSCDAVLDTKARQIAIFSGWAYEMQPKSWEVADKRTYVKWADKKYDVMVFGMPQFFHYGEGMGTNPVMLMQALSANVIRFKRIMSDNCVIICQSLCNGYFNDELWPYTREMWDKWMNFSMDTLPDMNRLGEYFATNEEYIRRYRYTNAFHPFHGFSMISCGHIAEMNTSAIYITGAEKPGIARGMGLKTRHTIEEALEDAKKKIVGPNPNVLALPLTFKTASVHLCMKDDVIENYKDIDM